MSGQISEIVILVISGTLIVLLLLVFVLTLAYIFRKRQLQNKKEKETLQARFASEILQTQIEVQNATLQQVGQELHDNIGQLLSVAKINLNILEDSPRGDQDQSYIIQTNEIIGQAIGDLRSLSKSLDGDFVKDFGLESSLSNELLRIKKTKKYQTIVEVVGVRYDLGYEREIVIFRISQEVLNNIIKHANASVIDVRLTYEMNRFSLSVSDDGKGFTNAPPSTANMQSSGSGLRNMRRRAEVIGGLFFIDSSHNGTTISIVIPINDHNQ